MLFDPGIEEEALASLSSKDKPRTALFGKSTVQDAAVGVN